MTTRKKAFIILLPALNRGQPPSEAVLRWRRKIANGRKVKIICVLWVLK